MVQIHNKRTFIFLTFIFPILIVSGCGDKSLSDETLMGYIDAKAVYIEGDIDEAETLFRAITESSPEFIQARFMLAKTSFFQGRTSEEN